MSTPSDIQRLITDFYGFRGAVDAAEQQATTGVDIGNLERYVKLKRVDEIEASDSHVVAAVEYLLHYALDQRASDVHIEPRRDHSAVRMRIDGVLHNVHTLPKVVHPAIVSRIKTLARLDIAEKRRPQDGRIKTARGDREVEMRVSTDRRRLRREARLRIFDPGALLQDLPDLGMFEPQLQLAEKFLARPHGLILVTGPTGSGKTTTLYAALRTIATPEVNVVTIEDPIEIVVDAFNQVAMQPKIGVTFAEALRHVLRQDPDVIMVGEVRDGETAEIALQAALTGHMVLATLHTNDAATAITRLLELGIDPFVLSSTLVGVVAQRLVRTVCAQCRVETFLTPDQMTLLGLDVHEMQAQGQDPRAHGGLRRGLRAVPLDGPPGRTGVFEVLEIDDKIRKLIIGKSAPRRSPSRRATTACSRCARPPSRSWRRGRPASRKCCGSRRKDDSVSDSFVGELRAAAQAGVPIVCVVTHEERRAIELVGRAFRGTRLQEWTATRGWSDDATVPSALAAIERAARAGETGVVRVMLDLHPWLGDARVVRALRDLAAARRELPLVLVMPTGALPPDSGQAFGISSSRTYRGCRRYSSSFCSGSSLRERCPNTPQREPCMKTLLISALALGLYDGRRLCADRRAAVACRAASVGNQTSACTLQGLRFSSPGWGRGRRCQMRRR